MDEVFVALVGDLRKCLFSELVFSRNEAAEHAQPLWSHTSQSDTTRYLGHVRPCQNLNFPLQIRLDCWGHRKADLRHSETPQPAGGFGVSTWHIVAFPITIESCLCSSREGAGVLSSVQNTKTEETLCPYQSGTINKELLAKVEKKEGL